MITKKVLFTPAPVQSYDRTMRPRTTWGSRTLRGAGGFASRNTVSKETTAVRPWSFTIIFALLGFLALQVPVVALVGSKAKFTLFDAFGPVAGGFLGPVFGTLAVALMQLANFFVHGAHVQDAGTVIRFFPMLFGALYFARKSRLMLLVPLVAIVAFIANPIGRTVWYYALFWLIPILAHFGRDRSLFLRSFGATFTSHAVGGALWVYAFHLPKVVWVSLIPVVIIERLVFAIGIAASYYALTHILAALVRRKLLILPFSLEQRLVDRQRAP